MFSKNIALSSLTAIAMFGIVGCAGQSDRDKLAEAQFCLDKSTTGTAASCLEKIKGIDSPQAHTLICSAGFIDAGVVSPENLSKAINAISNDENGGSVTMLASLSFGVGKKVQADSANSSCAKSGSAGFALLGAMAKAATSLTNLGGISLGSCQNTNSCSITEITQGIESNLSELLDVIENGNKPDLTQDEAVDAAVEIAGSIVDVYEATCGAVVINKDICSEIDQAASTAGPGGSPIIIAEIIALPDGDARKDELKSLAMALLETWKPTP